MSLACNFYDWSYPLCQFKILQCGKQFVLLCVQTRSSRRFLRLKLHWMMLMFWSVQKTIIVSFAARFTFFSFPFSETYTCNFFFSWDQIRKMDLEARSLQPSAKAMMLAKLREYKSDLNKLKREFKRIASPNADQASREDLLESGMADVHLVCLDHPTPIFQSYLFA